MEKEIWKDIPGYEGFYQVSNLGNIKVLKRKGVTKNRITKGFKSGNYYMIALSKNNNYQILGVHQVVAMVFLNHKPNGHKIVVDHINNISTDNRLINLQLISNRKNLSKDKKGKSKFVGVYYNNKTKKWIASLRHFKKRIYLGSFSSEEEAGKYYKEAIKSIEKGTKIKKKLKYKLAENSDVNDQYNKSSNNN